MGSAGILNSGAKGLSSLWIPSRLVRDLRAILSHAQEDYLTFLCGGSCKPLPKGDIAQNAFLTTKIENVRSNSLWTLYKLPPHGMIRAYLSDVWNAWFLSGICNPHMMNEYLIPNLPFLRPFINGIAIYGVNNGSNQCVIMLTSCHIGQKADRCGVVIHCLDHCTKPKGASERVYMGRQFATTEINRFFFYKASIPIQAVCILMRYFLVVARTALGTTH